MLASTRPATSFFQPPSRTHGVPMLISSPSVHLHASLQGSATLLIPQPLFFFFFMCENRASPRYFVNLILQSLAVGTQMSFRDTHGYYPHGGVDAYLPRTPSLASTPGPCMSTSPRLVNRPGKQSSFLPFSCPFPPSRPPPSPFPEAYVHRRTCPRSELGSLLHMRRCPVAPY
ncbi:hypothetical protein LX36DRAFT_130230 [Colletotrichum falcatum]|nr:hypothetical protein LX36DRAFT_130230 [Colletotrichum falcatum]